MRLVCWFSSFDLFSYPFVFNGSFPTARVRKRVVDNPAKTASNKKQLQFKFAGLGPLKLRPRRPHRPPAGSLQAYHLFSRLPSRFICPSGHDASFPPSLLRPGSVRARSSARTHPTHARVCVHKRGPDKNRASLFAEPGATDI